LNGSDPKYDWGPAIPHAEKAYSKNPDRGYLSSANQHVTDPSFPYYLGPWFVESYRGNRINQRLSTLNNATLEDFVDIQMDTKHTLAEQILPHMLRGVSKSTRDKYTEHFTVLNSWDYFSNADSKAPLIFDLWMKAFEALVWEDELGKLHDITWPDYARLAQLIIDEKDSPWIDIKSTSKIETYSDLMNASFGTTIKSLTEKFGPISEKWNWGNSRGTEIHHLAKIPGFGRSDLQTGGGSFIPNATNTTFGPSWRYVVELTTPPKGRGLYPGGQSGFPGSKYYDDMVDGWIEGEMYEFHSSGDSNEIPGHRVLITRGGK